MASGAQGQACGQSKELAERRCVDDAPLIAEVVAVGDAGWVTAYFERKVLRDRPYVTVDRCLAVLANPLRREPQPDGRWRAWGQVTLPDPLGTRILRVVTLADGTLHDAFVDRGFQERP